MLYILDVDGTLVHPHTELLMPGVQAWIDRFDFTKDQMALATNQGGVGLRFWMKLGEFGKPETYPSQEEVMARLGRIQAKLVGQHTELCPIYAAFAYQSKSTGLWGPTPFDLPAEDQAEEAIYTGPPEWSRAWRKPSPGMILHAIAVAKVQRDQAVMIGDSNDDDRGAADACGVQFTHAQTLFQA